MSLNVPENIIAAAQAGRLVTNEAFARVIHDSLPDAFGIVRGLAAALNDKPNDDHAVYAPAQMDDGTRGQLLRLMASDAIRGAVEREFGFRLAFQNCHKVAAFRPDAVGGSAWQAFTSIEAQVLNQSPEFRDC